MQSISTLQQRQRGCQRPSTPPPPVEIMPCQPYSSITRDECRKNKMRRIPCLCDRCCPVPFNQGDPEEERNPLGADVVIVREKCCMRDIPDEDIDWKIGCFFGEPKIAGARRRWTFEWLDPHWRDEYTERELWDMSDEVPPEQKFIPRAARRFATAPVAMSASSPSLATFSTASSLSSYARTASSTAVTPRASSSDVTNPSIYSIPLSTSPAGYSVKCSSEQPLDTAIANTYPSTSAVAIPVDNTDALPASFSRAATDLSTSSQSTASSTAFSTTFSYTSLSASTPATPYSATCYSPSSPGSFSTQAGTPFPVLSSLSPVTQKSTASPEPPRIRQDSTASQLSSSGNSSSARWCAQAQGQGRPSMQRACTVGEAFSADARPARKFSALKGLRGMFAPSAATVATCDARRLSRGDE